MPGSSDSFVRVELYFDLVSFSNARVDSSSICAFSRSWSIIWSGMPSREGEYPRTSWNELIIFDPFTQLVIKDARAMIFSALALLSYFSMRFIIALKTPLLRSTRPNLFDDRDGLPWSTMSCFLRKFCKTGLQNSWSALKRLGAPCL